MDDILILRFEGIPDQISFPTTTIPVQPRLTKTRFSSVAANMKFGSFLSI